MIKKMGNEELLKTGTKYDNVDRDSIESKVPLLGNTLAKFEPGFDTAFTPTFTLIEEDPALRNATSEWEFFTWGNK